MKDNILYIFKNGRSERLKGLRSNKERFPSEFFYGYVQLKDDYKSISILEEKDFGLSKDRSFIFRLINLLHLILGNLPIGTFVTFLNKKKLKRLSNYSVIVVSTNTLGMTLAMLKTFGLINSKIIFITMGLFKIDSGKWFYFLNKLFIKNVNLVSLSKTETIFLQNILPKQNIYEMSFGIDSNFWYQNKYNSSDNNYILAVGNDLNRDWQFLVNSWQPNFPKLKILTNHKLINSKFNVEIIKGDFHKQIISDLELRSLYQKSKFIIIINKNTIQPAGQSVCLQAMACGKPVIMTRTVGLWDNSKLIHKKNIILVKLNDQQDLIDSINTLLNKKNLRYKLSQNGLKLISKYYNVQKMANSFYSILKRSN